ncbi:MAG: hypothetical protein IKT13_05090, partial [Paludibacteraceae bacterium]|nr:hypothetical protein [Paludibacteraceae bacterium]
FTVNADGDQVQFAQGNLRATTTDLGEHWTWSFATNQWDVIARTVANNAINGNGTVSENGTVDLFGWSTANTFFGINNSTDNSDYSGNFVDWGKNPISNGGNTANQWRTLSKDEWEYILNTRDNHDNLRGHATVNSVKGFILLPDNWTIPSGLSFTNSIENYTTNQYNGADWTAMESAGAVFLPAAGVREGADIYQVNLYGWYWASTPNETDGGKAYYLYFYKSSVGVTEYDRWKSKSVRLVTEAPIPPYEAAIKLINAIPSPLVRTAACMAAVDAARAAYDALSSEDQALVTNYATLVSAETYFDPQMVWNNLPAGGVVGTIGHEDEISLPLLNGSPDFYDALYNLQISVTLRSTNENILKVSGFNNFKVYAPGECDVYAVHYATDGKFAYDSVAFHVTINPATPTPVSVVLPTVKYAVCNVPDGWTVTANGDAVLPINGRYHIVDGQTVVLTPSILTNEYVVTSEEPALLGAGTAEDPYLIYTVANWNAVAAKVNDGTQAAAHCIQMANLDGVTTVMGNSETYPFKGIYDGNGFVFTNINLSITSGSNPLGLFGCVNDASAVVKNVVVAGGTVFSTSQNVGTIVGQLNGGTVQYCANYATIASTYNGKVRMGGIVGWMRSAGGDNNRVDHCINYGNLSGKGYVGGITGSYGAGYVSYCQNYGSISSAGTDDATSGSAGGIIGWDAADDATKITYNHNGGNITEAKGHGYKPSRYIIANTNSGGATSVSVIVPSSNSYLSWLTLTIGSTNYTGAELATHEPSAQAVTGNPEGISISGITYAYNTVAPIAPAPGTNPGTDPAQQSNKTWQFTMPSHNVGLTVTIVPTEVIAKIAAIPDPVTLKLATRDSIESARAAYEALTADQQALVS